MKALKTLAVLCILTAAATTTSTTYAGVKIHFGNGFGNGNHNVNQNHNFSTFNGGNSVQHPKFQQKFNHNFFGQQNFQFNQNFSHQGNFKVIFVNGRKVVVFVGNGNGDFGHNTFNTFGFHH